jgi:hypothetical protein
MAEKGHDRLPESSSSGIGFIWSDIVMLAEIVLQSGAIWVAMLMKLKY